MPAKKSTAKKGKSSVKKDTTTRKKMSSPRKDADGGTPRYACPNTGRKYSLEEIVREMAGNQELAIFIRGLLCQLRGGSDKEKAQARECLETYYTLTDSDLKKLCIPRAQRLTILASRCTECDDNSPMFLDVPAYVAATTRRRKR